MHFQGITSLAVLDNKKHVIGNISHVDVKVRDTTHIGMNSVSLTKAAAPHKYGITTTSQLVLHPFPQRHPFRARYE